MQITGDEWENSRVTRSRPADGSPFRDYEVVRADLGPTLPDDEWTSARGGRQISIKCDIAGIYRTPLSPRDHPEVLADYKAVRARIERKNGVLHQFASVTRARVWGAIAAWHAYMAVLGSFVIALTNMELYVTALNLGLADNVVEALVRLVAGYTVARSRVTKAVALAEALLLAQFFP